ncbi:MAG: GTPase domain-containing protein [Nitrospirales bacterium]
MTALSSSITLSLISHTNIGKTTLARTLLRRDVGQVLDQAHVTLQNEHFVLLETSDGSRLNLWDTPGFGNSHKLLGRLQGLTNPIGWMVSQVWDRIADKPFWCSQQAIRNVRDEADVVLYLVNAAEDPSMAGYLQPELDLLTWLDKPVIVLVNQTGLIDPQQQRKLESLWRQHWVNQRVIKDVMSLDAFTRCWVQEGVLWDHVTQALPPEKHHTMEKLGKAWDATHRQIFDTSMTRLAQLLIETALDGERLPQKPTGLSKKPQIKNAIKALDQRLAQRISAVTADLIELHGLTGDVPHTVKSRIEDVTVPGERKPWEEETFWGALASGAAAGLASDLATGGLSHGAFTIGGAILGALAERTYAKSQETEDSNLISWVPAFLDRQTRDALLRYLAVTHCGRGRGDYTDPREFPLFWQRAAETIIAQRKDELHHAWKQAQFPQLTTEKTDQVQNHLVHLLSIMTREILLQFYPEAKGWLEISSR